MSTSDVSLPDPLQPAQGDPAGVPLNRTDQVEATPLAAEQMPLVGTTGGVAPAVELPPVPRSFWRGGLLYPRSYAAYLAFGLVDLLVTWIVLQLSGSEVNPIARYVIEAYSVPGLTAYKFALAALVIVICEIVGRRRPALGRALATLAVCVTLAVAVFGATLLVLRLMLDRADFAF